MFNIEVRNIPANEIAGAPFSVSKSAKNFGMATAAVLFGLTISGCVNKDTSTFSPSKYGVPGSPRVVQPGEPVPKGGGSYMVGSPYKIAGKWYYPKHDPLYAEEGETSWYGPIFHGRLTANGEVYDQEGLSAAHRTMPLPSYARVTNLKSGSSIVLRVNDRGPFHSDRIVDVSGKAAELLDVKRHGTSRVRVEYLGKAGLDGLDYQNLLASYRPNGSNLSGNTQFAGVYKTPKRRPGSAPTQVASASGARQIVNGVLLPRPKPRKLR